MQDRSALRAWAQRWPAVNAQTDRESAALTMAGRLVALSQLVAFARRGADGENDTTLWERLQRLRGIHRTHPHRG